MATSFSDGRSGVPGENHDHGQATGNLYYLRLRVQYTLFCNLQSRARTHVVLMIDLYSNYLTHWALILLEGDNELRLFRLKMITKDIYIQLKYNIATKVGIKSLFVKLQLINHQEDTMIKNGFFVWTWYPLMPLPLFCRIQNLFLQIENISLSSSFASFYT
jgi:hypothetical protein